MFLKVINRYALLINVHQVPEKVYTVQYKNINNNFIMQSIHGLITWNNITLVRTAYHN